MTKPAHPQVDAREIPLALLDRDGKFQYRSEKDGKEIESLITSIRADGQLQPIIVRALTSGRYQLISGYRRSAALLALKMKTAKAVVWPQMSDEQAMRVAIAENTVRESLSEYDKVRTALQLRESGVEKQKVADAFNVSSRTLERWCAVAKAPEDFRRALADSKTTIQAVYTALQKKLSLDEILVGEGRGRSVRALQELSRNKGAPNKSKTLLRTGRDGSLIFSLRYLPGERDIEPLIKEVTKLLQKLQQIQK